MKKALTRTLLIAISIVILAGVMPLSANASSTTSSNKTTIFSYLTNQLGFNSAAACGIMANIEQESNFKSGTIIRDSNGLLSGGLCQWNGIRLSNLKNYCNKNGLNYLSIEGQLNYLEHELQKNQYSHIYKYLKSVADTAKGAYDAAHYWCYYFEVPANRGSKSVQRAKTALKSYWPVYGGKELEKPELNVASGTTYEPNKKLTVKWSSAGEDADGYRVYLVKKDADSGKYDYDNAKVAKVNSKTRSFTIKAKNMKVGTYKIYVYAYNSITDTEVRSNVLTIKIKCKTHDYEAKITKVPTEEANGIKTFTCVNCTKAYEEPITLYDYIDQSQVQKVRITGVATNAIKVRWNEFEQADGYRVYVKEGSKWVSLGTTSQEDDKAFMVRNLESGKTYTFKVKAFKEVDGKRVNTISSKSVTATTKTA